MKKLNPYTPELREVAVKLVLEQGLTLEDAALRLAIPKGTLGNWVSAARRGNGPKAATGVLHALFDLAHVHIIQTLLIPKFCPAG